MTEWNAQAYARISALQQAMAAEVLSLLDLKDAKSVLDLGCGNGKSDGRDCRARSRGQGGGSGCVGGHDRLCVRSTSARRRSRT